MPLGIALIGLKKQMLIKYQLKVNYHYNHTYICILVLNINSNMDIDLEISRQNLFSSHQYY